MAELSFGALFLLGLLGSGHCVGMCGPLVLSLPPKQHLHLIYHLGRGLTYTALGALLGLLGSVASLVALQQGLALLSAGLLVGLGLIRLKVLNEPKALLGLSLGRLPLLRRAVRGLRGRHPAFATLGFGLLMGFLPCGLSYAALVRASAAPSPLIAAGLVAAFALGTVPALFLLGTASASFAQRHRAAFDLAAGLLMVGLAVSLLVDTLAALFS